MTNFDAASDATLLEDLEISFRVFNACRRAGLRTVGDLRAIGPMALRRLPMIGRAALREIEAEIGEVTEPSEPAKRLLLLGISTPDLVAELSRRFPSSGKSA